MELKPIDTFHIKIVIGIVVISVLFAWVIMGLIVWGYGVEKSEKRVIEKIALCKHEQKNKGSNKPINQSLTEDGSQLNELIRYI